MKMKILVLNCGSSSLKYQLIDMENDIRLVKGNYERIGEKNSSLRLNVKENKTVIDYPVKDYDEAIEVILKLLMSKECGVIESLDEINAIGHRIVHGGEMFSDSVIITDEVIQKIEECSVLAPLHNPASVRGIMSCKKYLPNKPMVAVFDTAFHQTMPKKAYIYPIPYEYYEKYKMRKYGFHGTSHRYIAERVAEIMKKDESELKIISCHIGQGASICAIDGGKSVDTSMGFTPLAGIPMGTRCGDIDPSIVYHIMKRENKTPDEMDKILNKESGAYGISGVSTDFRDIEEELLKGNERAILALENAAYKIAQYIAQYIVSLNGVDVIAFAGGVGEKGIEERERICKYLEVFGAKLDTEKNQVKGSEREISSQDSKIKMFVVPTNEELMIAKDTLRLISNN